MVGAGVVGLAIARQLARAGREVLVVERNAAIGQETSSRNSEVIHAGIYYAPGSLKAHLCRRGRDLLYAYCGQRGIPHRRCGKLIVAAAPAEAEGLERLQRNAQANDVEDLVWLQREQALRLEPELQCAAALLSPSTGIIDAHAFMLALLGEAQEHCALLALHSEVARLRAVRGGIELTLAGAAEAELSSRWLINAAGLSAVELALRIEGLPEMMVPPAHFAKGSYFALGRAAPFARLVYPMPEPGGVGVHLTLDLAGRARFGPDVEWVAAPDYQVEARRAEHFYARIRQYWPGLRDGELAPDYAGVRPKLAGPGAPAADFRIDGPQQHGVPGLVNLFGIESPGLTAALAIAEHIAGMVESF